MGAAELVDSRRLTGPNLLGSFAGAVMDVRLRDREFLAGELSIADFASFPWVIPYKRYGTDLDRFENVRRWFDTLKARPAVQRGVDVGKDWKRDEATQKRAHSVMFGQNADTVFEAAAAMDDQ